MSKLKKKMFRDIKLNKSQFIAIFLMVFLGVLVYGGVRSYMDGMVNTAEVFYRENNLEDLNVVGSNFSKDDLEKIKNMENSMISEKPCAGPDVFSWGFSASDKDRFFADFSKNRKTVKKYHT